MREITHWIIPLALMCWSLGLQAGAKAIRWAKSVSAEHYIAGGVEEDR